MVAFSFLAQNFGRWRGTMNSTLSFYECRLSGGDTQKWWGHSNPTCCNQFYLNFLHSQAAVMLRHHLHACSHLCASLHLKTTLWNFHNIYYHYVIVLRFIISVRIGWVEAIKNRRKQKRYKKVYRGYFYASVSKPSSNIFKDLMLICQKFSSLFSLA